MNNKYNELAKKLNALANQGVAEGERYNAKIALDAVMKQYNISMADIEESTQVMTPFFSPKKYDYLFFQVALTVVDSKREMGTVNADKRYKVVKVTKLEELEIRAKWNFYKKAYDEQIKVFMGAFILKNQLFSTDEKDEAPKELTPEQKELIIKSSVLAHGMEKSDYIPQIKNG